MYVLCFGVLDLLNYLQAALLPAWVKSDKMHSDECTMINEALSIRLFVNLLLPNIGMLTYE